jgi:hypothetical protein
VPRTEDWREKVSGVAQKKNSRKSKNGILLLELILRVFLEILSINDLTLVQREHKSARKESLNLEDKLLILKLVQKESM